MRLTTALLVGGALLSSISGAFAQAVDWQSVDQIFSRKAAVVAGDVHRYGFPRTDLNVIDCREMSLFEIEVPETSPETEWVRGRPLQKRRVIYVHQAGSLQIRANLDHKEYRPGQKATIGLQLVGPPHSESQLLSVAAWCERVLAFKAAPPE